VDTITLEQSGYPSVAWASDAQFPEARDIIFYSFQGKRIKLSIRDVFRSALHIYIVADNDASGLAAARKRREALGRGDIISTPSEKDVNDCCRQHTIAEWLPNVPPILEKNPTMPKTRQCSICGTEMKPGQRKCKNGCTPRAKKRRRSYSRVSRTPDWGRILYNVLPNEEST